MWGGLAARLPGGAPCRLDRILQCVQESNTVLFREGWIGATYLSPIPQVSH